MRRILALFATTLASPSLAQDVGQARFSATIMACSPVLTPDLDQCAPDFGRTLEWLVTEHRFETAAECEEEVGEHRSAQGAHRVLCGRRQRTLACCLLFRPDDDRCGVGASASMTLTTTSSGATSGANYLAENGTAAVRWTGAGSTFVDAQNATGNFSFRTGATPTVALTISASQVIQVPAIATGTPAASVCIDASNNIIKKTTTGPCI